MTAYCLSGNEIFSHLASLGLAFLILPILFWQVRLTANMVEPGLDSSDLKQLWFYIFYLGLFPLINTIFVSNLNYLVHLSSLNYSENNLMTKIFFQNIWIYASTLYGLLTIGGLIWRYIKKEITVFEKSI
jgi:hypothetical protein